MALRMASSSPPSAAALMVVVRFVRPVFRHLTRAVEGMLEGTGISLPVRGVLERLYEAGPASVPTLARALGIPRQFAQKLVDEAAALGLTERRPNPAHRTSALIALTDQGRATIEALLAREMEALDVIARGFDADEVEVAGRVLGDLVTAFRTLAEADALSGRDPAAPPTPPTD